MNREALREGDGTDPRSIVAVEMLQLTLEAITKLYGGHEIALDKAAGAALSVGISTMVALYGRGAARKEIEDWVKRVFDDPKMFSGAEP